MTWESVEKIQSKRIVEMSVRNKIILFVVSNSVTVTLGDRMLIIFLFFNSVWRRKRGTLGIFSGDWPPSMARPLARGQGGVGAANCVCALTVQVLSVVCDGSSTPAAPPHN